MKKLIATLAVIILTLSVAGCESYVPAEIKSATDPTSEPDSIITESPTEAATNSENIDSIITKMTLDKNQKELTERFDEIGIIEGEIAFEESITFTDGTKGKVYLIRDMATPNSGLLHNNYLAVETADDYYIEEIGPYYKTTVYVNDLDGDKADEITTCCNTGGTALAKSGHVYKFENGVLNNIFSSTGEDYWDTGFEGITKDNYIFEITNRFTGYITTLKLGNENYIDRCYDESGKVKEEGKMGLLSFRDFYTDDKDNDGIYEIHAEQHAYFVGKEDGLGYTKCTYKFNEESKKFEVVDAELVSPYNMDDEFLIQQGEYYSAYKYDNCYFYKITDENGTVRFSRSGIIKLPDFNMLNDNLLEVTDQSGTGVSTNWAFYYDAETDKLSKNFNYVLSGTSELVAYCKRDGNEHSIIVQDKFDVSKYCKKFTVTTSSMTDTVVEPVISVKFSDDGKSIEVVYLAGDKLIKTTETFELY